MSSLRELVLVMVLTDFIDPYLDPETGTLRNKVGAQSQTALAKVEGDALFARVMQLLDRPQKATNDLEELQVIHRNLFQDIFDWAG